MTNREKLGNMALYDMLLMMNENIEDKEPECVLDAIGAEVEGRCANVSFCRDCIARWLNEECDE